MIKTVDLSVEHVLLFVVFAFLLYYLLGTCGCRYGFSVGDQVEYYYPIKFTGGVVPGLSSVYYGCKGAFGAAAYIPCPPYNSGNRGNPPNDPSKNPLNWKCKKNHAWEADDCVTVTMNV